MLKYIIITCRELYFVGIYIILKWNRNFCIEKYQFMKKIQLTIDYSIHILFLKIIIGKWSIFFYLTVYI